MAHTPGPWQANGVGGTHDGGSNKQHPHFRGDVVASNGQPIVSFLSLLGVQGENPKEAEANAHLIAAAPCLLAACKEILAHECEEKPCLRCAEVARKAIAAAEGRTP